jgi:benzoyl-CoA reductase subunit C
MKQVMDRFREIVSEPYSWARKKKESTDKKIIGCFPMGVPEEIIHAASMIPIMLLGSGEPIKEAQKYLPQQVCSVMRSNFDMCLRKELDFLDGIIFPDICDAIQRLSDVWRIHCPLPFHHNIASVVQDTPSGMKFLTEEFVRLKGALEEFFHIKISDEAIGKSIAVFDENRSLLDRLNQLRRLKPDLFKARDFPTIVGASMFMDKQEHSRLLSELLEKAGPAAKSDVSKGERRVVLSGNLCQHPLWPLLDLLDELGIWVVDDDLYVGTNYFATGTKFPSESPIAALAERYIKDVPSPAKINVRNGWAEYLIQIIRRSGAGGVILLRLMYCDSGFDYPHLRKKLSEHGIPDLLIEIDQVLDLVEIRSKLESFIEIVGGK